MISKGIFKFIRLVHVSLETKDLPSKIGLYFHSIGKNDICKFVEVLEYFKNLGYITQDPLTYGMNNDKSLYISFDDNYCNWMNIAEILSKRGEVGTFFTNTGPLSDRSSSIEINNYYDRIKHFNCRKSLSSTDLFTIFHDYKQILGGHTCNHLNLTQIQFHEAKIEILNNKKELENIIGSEIVHFSYPFGLRRYFNDSLRTYCKEIGYQTISNAIPGLLYQQYDRYDINRTMWNFGNNLSFNLQNIRVNACLFEKITGKSAIG